MRPRSAAILACRIIGIWLGIQAVLMAISLLVFTRELEGTGEFWAIVGTTAIIAWALWIAAESLSTSMTRGAPDEAPPSPRSTANVHTVAFSIVGVILIASSIPALVGIAVSEVPGFGSFSFGFPIAGAGTGFGRGAAFAVEAVRLFLGLLLIIASGDLARALSRRYPDREEAPPATPPERG